MIDYICVLCMCVCVSVCVSVCVHVLVVCAWVGAGGYVCVCVLPVQLMK